MIGSIAIRSSVLQYSALTRTSPVPMGGAGRPAHFSGAAGRLLTDTRLPGEVPAEAQG